MKERQKKRVDRWVRVGEKSSRGRRMGGKRREEGGEEKRREVEMGTLKVLPVVRLSDEERPEMKPVTTGITGAFIGYIYRLIALANNKSALF
jgi:hypothetical protein